MDYKLCGRHNNFISDINVKKGYNVLHSSESSLLFLFGDSLSRREIKISISYSKQNEQEIVAIFLLGHSAHQLYSIPNV